MISAQEVIVYAIIAAAAISAIIYFVKRLKKGGGGCNCGCGSPNCKGCKGC